MSGVCVRILEAGRRIDGAGVGVPGPPKDFLAAAGPGVAADRPATLAPPMLGRAVLGAFGVIPEASPVLLAVLAPNFVGLEDPALSAGLSVTAA